MALSQPQRKAFDALLNEVIASLPPKWRLVLEDVRIIIDDRPRQAVLDSLEMSADQALELCGLHTGVPRTERGLEEGFDGESLGFLSEIELYREGILLEAGGGEMPATLPDDRDAVREQIRITLLHELGHELGLDEDDLERLGYD